MRTSGAQFSNEKPLVCGFELRILHTLREFLPGPITLIPLVSNNLHITHMVRRNTKFDFLPGGRTFLPSFGEFLSDYMASRRE